ncbi:hypothetical protein AB0H58_19235 [Nocardia neocaledoniensis]|uniref:Ig-like domain-containing protein n=1 Tax=Nocardia neocaledoniensis TaxID=236511 RepID=A0A317NKV6_9NOCA|nr:MULTISPECIES: hypothetical protein [Nocardia]PWV75234.1 hypothetical protein DFR69_105308 [Nocardia neocaledoniensis]UGT55446.1 hypothetical protein LTT85_00775 [Nocardia asteroides]GEM33795.1 hypothetical protein NN3_48020 [Nocardia neocaledoniensis NBRC 108232]
MSDRKFAFAIAATGTALLAMTIGSPSAGAAVSQLTVDPGLSVGSATNYGTGCTHHLVARLSVGIEPVSFYDNGALLAVVTPTDGIADLTWVPTSTGPHTLAALQGGVGRGADVHVGRGYRFGESCVVTGG